MCGCVVPVIAILVRRPWNPRTVVGCFSYEDLLTQSIRRGRCFQSPQQKLILRDVFVDQLLLFLLSIPRAQLCSSPLVLSTVLIFSEFVILYQQ